MEYLVKVYVYKILFLNPGSIQYYNEPKLYNPLAQIRQYNAYK